MHFGGKKEEEGRLKGGERGFKMRHLPSFAMSFSTPSFLFRSRPFPHFFPCFSQRNQSVQFNFIHACSHRNHPDRPARGKRLYSHEAVNCPRQFSELYRQRIFLDVTSMQQCRTAGLICASQGHATSALNGGRGHLTGTNPRKGERKERTARQTSATVTATTTLRYDRY